MATPTKSYTKQVFSNWINMVGLAAVFGSGFIFGPWAFVVGLALEAFALWTIPDIPAVQRALDADAKQADLVRQRWYYLNVLWGIQPTTSGNWFIAEDTNWQSVISNRSPNGAIRFSELCAIVDGLLDFRKARPDAFTDDVLSQINERINGYLSLLYVVKTADDNIKQIDQRSLAAEFAKLQGAAKNADPSDRAGRIIMGERLRSIKARVDALPKLERRKDYADAQAENIYQQIKAMSVQIRTSGALEVGSLEANMLLNPMEALDSSGVDEMDVVAEVRGLTSNADADIDNPSLWNDLASKLNMPSAPVPALTADAPMGDGWFTSDPTERRPTKVRRA